MEFTEIDIILRSKNGKIVHQVWFGTIPNKTSAKKAYSSMKQYRESWKLHNPDWFHVEWSKKMCNSLVTTFYPEHSELYKNYKYEIQRCDAIRYLILHRYGGWYVDMDYVCNRSLREAHEKFTNDIYLVQSPNGTIGQDTDHVSNSLMYAIPQHAFWKQLMLELEKNQNLPYWYTKHLTVMFSTGPGILNRAYAKYKYKYRVKSLPWKLFHPYGIKDDVRSLRLSDEIFAAHIGKSTWIGKDTEILLFLVREWKLLLFIIGIMTLSIVLIKVAK